MKQVVKITGLTLLAIALTFSIATAQLIQSNNLGIYPPGGLFNPLGKLTSLGESGGVQGPTANGCDLYGFRSQVDSANAVSLGLQEFAGLFVPTLSFESTAGLPLSIQIQNPPVNNGTGGLTGCGQVLALYNAINLFGPPPTNNFVYNIFGSGFASGGMWIASDKELKRKIKPIKNAIDIVEQLNGVTYEYRADERPELHLGTGRHYGFVTQEVKEVMPEAVSVPLGVDGQPADFEAMNYDMIIPVLTEAIKIQQQAIEAQEEANANLEARVAQLEALLAKERSSNASSSLNEQAEKISLQQNRPNPSTGLTTIEYSLPTTLTNAELTVYDANGRLVSRQNINTGDNSVEVDTNAFGAGIYFYALEVNGQQLARQKMIVK